MMTVDPVGGAPIADASPKVTPTLHYLELPASREKIPLEMLVQYVYLMLIQMKQEDLLHAEQHLQAEQRSLDAISKRRADECEHIAQKEDSKKLVATVDHYRSALTSAAAGIQAIIKGKAAIGAAGLIHGTLEAADELFGGKVYGLFARIASSVAGGSQEDWRDRLYLASSIASIGLCFGADKDKALAVVSSLGQVGTAGVSHYIQWTAEQHKKSFAQISAQEKLAEQIIDDASQKLADATSDLFKFYEAKLKALESQNQFISRYTYVS